MKTKILIDAKPLLSSLTGVGRYAYEIIKSLEKSKFDRYFDYGFISQDIILCEDPQNLSPKGRAEYKLLKGLKKCASFLPQNLKTAIKAALKSFNERSSKELKFDIYFQPNFIPLDINATHVVVTVHDLAFIKFKEFHPKERVEYFDRYFLSNITRATKLITVSNAIKREMVSELGIKESLVEVIYNGYDSGVFYKKDEKEVQNLKDKLGIKKDFILFVGSIEPRKNLATLIKAYNLLAPNLQDKFELLIVGAKGWENSETHKLIKQNKNIKFLGFIEDEDLASLYSAASLFVYPSVYEGFGIPPLEAMACGCPVVLSRIEVFEEIYGENAVYFDALNENELKERMQNLLENEALRAKFSELSLRHCQNFSWKKSAQEHLRLFEEILR